MAGIAPTGVIHSDISTIANWLHGETDAGIARDVRGAFAGVPGDLGLPTRGREGRSAGGATFLPG